MARFEIGQKIVCINDSGWIKDNWFVNFFKLEIESDGPWYLEECTVTGYERPHYVTLEGYGKTEGFIETEFEPMMDISELQEIAKCQEA